MTRRVVTVVKGCLCLFDGVFKIDYEHLIIPNISRLIYHPLFTSLKCWITFHMGKRKVSLFTRPLKTIIQILFIKFLIKINGIRK